MRRNILIILVSLIFFNNTLLSQDFQIKSLRVFSSTDQTDLPVIDSTNPNMNNITIEFDTDGEYQPNLMLLFRFCDINWQPYENVFLLNPRYDAENNLWLDRLSLRVKGAKYHYTGTFPNQNVNFPFPGKWKFFIVDQNERDRIYGEGRFYVVSKEVKLKVAIDKGRVEGSIPEPVDLGRSISIKTFFNLPDSVFPTGVKMIEIIENKKVSYPIIVDRQLNHLTNYYEWNGSDRFVFVAKDLLPGNEYRNTDFRDENRFNQPVINPQHTGIETSNFFKKGLRDLNGGSIFLDYRNDYSEYVKVNFKIRPPENITSSVFLVGSFNDWKVLPKYEMFDDNGLLNLQLQLKRGVYDYQYVTGDLVGDEVRNIDWHILEGNFWETNNEYNIFLFYESQEKGGYDKIIGYQKINSGELWKN